MRKGQKRTEESKIKHRKTAMKTLVSRYDWNIIEPYLDSEINNGSTGRTKKYITFREFKENIENEISLKGMIRQGISHHFIGFLSNFCQGKIKLTKDKFIEEYEKGKSLDEMEKEYKIPSGNIRYLRQLYGIKRKGANFIKRKKTETRLTQRQIEILYGTMMGDSKRQHTKLNSIAGFKHSTKQKEYLFWKFNEFKSVCKEKNLKHYSQYDKRYDKIYEGWTFYTKANTDVETCIKEFYKSGVKEVSIKILEYLTPLSIAVLYMDDGTTDFFHRFIIKDDYKYTPRFKFCTDSFSIESCNNIVKWFKSKYNINTYLIERELKTKMGYRVVIHNNSIEDFISLIRPYIIPSMLYKIDYEEYKIWRKKKELLKESQNKKNLIMSNISK